MQQTIQRSKFEQFYIFRYSPDRLYRMTIALIKFLAKFPCPTCFTLKVEIHEMGTMKDKKRRSKLRIDDDGRRKIVEKARKRIFKEGRPLTSKHVKDILNTNGSLIAVRNAYSNVPDDSFNFHSLFVPDLLHEFELGVWKAIFTHLMRILVAQGGNAVTELNKRYRAIPTFGQSTIRRFSNDASSMRKLAARDFEDLLQCALPVFEGLLPSPHNERVLDLLFALVEWHAYAKLRLHTDTTLKLFEKSTVDFGRQVHLFKRTTCEAYSTKELPQEIAARGRRKAALAKKGHIPRNQTQEETGETSKTKTLNINTYKFHAIGHYPASIKQYGTTDSHSTQIVS